MSELLERAFGALGPAPPLEQYVEGMRNGAGRPKGRAAYNPNTVRSYERAVKRHIAGSAVGGLKVADVRRQDVHAYLASAPKAEPVGLA